MKSFFIALFTSLLLLGCFAPERNCKDFKTGSFEFESYLNGEMVKTTFVRTDSLEIDYFKDKVDSSSIRWINDCEYILTNLNPKNMAEEKPLHMKILTTKGDTYTFEFSVVGEDKKQKGTARKVK
ncbi:DNA topoisomerase IV [Mesonia aestuariivivens]|uniref:DNA topoisomerase IV n=1 Tax=Mesonia aestuariivivens TaxID=2796128 RepID=A0ABS6VYM7_9FLAO|nr:DNA topoisomerase IV [Mesonia aestuariivivens]MBW2960699.1 DNA topoisomerase IV [Mesonia aestuariivivens]